MKKHICLFIISIFFTNVYSQKYLLSEDMTYPDMEKNEEFSIYLSTYKNDTLVEKSTLLTYKINKANKIQRIDYKSHSVVEFYYPTFLSRVKFKYKKDKEKISTRYSKKDAFYKRESDVYYYTDSTLMKTKFTSKRKITYLKSSHEKRKKIRLNRVKKINHYYYENNIDSTIQIDTDGDKYVYTYDSVRNCIQKTYYGNNTLSWTSYKKYDTNSNLIEDVEIDNNNNINWLIQYEYNDLNQLILVKKFHKGDFLYYQLSFSYLNDYLIKREEIDFKSNEKSIYEYQY